MDGHVGGFTIEESARRLGHYRWASIRLFEVLGSWVASVPEPDVKVFLAAASRRHGWHADLLRERLPEVRELNIGHAIVAQALFTGFDRAVRDMKALMVEARRAA